MNWKGKLDSRQSFCALAGPMVHAFAGCSWPAAVLFAAVSWALHRCLGAGEEKIPAWLYPLRELWQVLAAVTLLNWLVLYWPGLRAEAVAASAVLLAVYAVSKGKAASARAWGVSWYAIAILLGSVLLSAVPMIEKENLSVWTQPGSLADASFASLLLFTLPTGSAILLGPAASICVTGVLGLTAGQAAFYELSRNIRLLGAVPRFESLAAASMTLSFGTALAGLLESREKAADWKKTILKGCTVFSLWYLGLEIPTQYLTIGCILLWIIPRIAVFQKIKKMSN